MTVFRPTILCAAGLALAAPAAQALPDAPLPRHAYLGLATRSLQPADVAQSQAPSLKGALVTGVLPGGPGAEAGVQAGDVLLAVDGATFADDTAFKSLLRKHLAGEAVELTVRRAGAEEIRRATAGALPPETSDEVELAYCAIPTKGCRLRGLVSSPLGSAGKRLPAVLVCEALGSYPLIGAGRVGPTQRLAYDLTKAGFRVMRFELRGVGDSEGQDYRTTDLETEIGDNRAALKCLTSRADVDAAHVYVWGHSTGGMVAAAVASTEKVAGLISSCTVGRTFYERMADTLRVQSTLGGNSPAATDALIRLYIDFASAMATGTPEAWLRRDKRYAQFFNAYGRIMDDRTVAFWRQQLNLNLADVYGKVKCPALVLWFDGDFLTELACHELIRDVLTTAGNPDVTLSVVHGVDHRFAQVKDAAESKRQYASGERTPSGEPMRVLVDWLRKRAAA